MASASFSRCSRSAPDGRDPQRGAVAEEDLGERLGDDGLDAPSHERLGGMFATRSAAEVPPGDENRCVLVVLVIERVFGILFAIVLEGVLAESVETDAAEITGRDDAVGIDIVQEEVNAGAGDLGDLAHNVVQNLMGRRCAVPSTGAMCQGKTACDAAGSLFSVGADGSVQEGETTRGVFGSAFGRHGPGNLSR